MNIVKFNGIEIKLNEEQKISLTDLWKADGAKDHEPWNWSRFEGKVFIEAVAAKLNLSTAQVLQKSVVAQEEHTLTSRLP